MRPWHRQADIDTHTAPQVMTNDGGDPGAARRRHTEIGTRRLVRADHDAQHRKPDRSAPPLPTTCHAGQGRAAGAPPALGGLQARSRCRPRANASRGGRARCVERGWQPLPASRSGGDLAAEQFERLYGPSRLRRRAPGLPRSPNGFTHVATDTPVLAGHSFPPRPMPVRHHQPTEGVVPAAAVLPLGRAVASRATLAQWNVRSASVNSAMTAERSCALSRRASRSSSPATASRWRACLP